MRNKITKEDMSRVEKTRDHEDYIKKVMRTITENCKDDYDRTGVGAPIDMLRALWNSELSDVDVMVGLSMMGLVMGKTKHFQDYEEDKIAKKAEDEMTSLKAKWGV